MHSCFYCRRLQTAVIANFRPGQLVALVLGMMACSLILPSDLHAQLRSGRTERSLYVDDLPQQTAAARAPQSNRPSSQGRKPVVIESSGSRMSVQANPGQSPKRVSSVNSSGLTSSGRSANRAAVVTASHVSTASCDDCGGLAGDAYSPYYEPGYVDSGACGFAGDCGCNAPGCDTCCYANVAPTCATLACNPCCSPLLSLWCRTQVRAEVPLFWRRSHGPPPLVTTAPSGTNADSAGQLGQSTTRTLLGNSILDDTVDAGVRLTFTTRLGDGDRYALMFRYWNAGDQDENYIFDSNAFPILARPFFNTSVANAPEQDTQLVAFPGDSVGNISVATRSEVDGLELTLKRMLYQDRFTRIDWLYGYQHVSIDEGLTISSLTSVVGGIPGLQGTSIAVSDRFETSNDFNGVAYGLMSTRQFACWKMETMFRLGMGNLRRKVNIAGTTTTTSSGTSNTTNQGLLARSTNDRPFQDDTFIVVPEVGINLAYRLRPGLDFTVGYNYMLVPKVAQASQQINDDLAVNLSDPLVGSLDPELSFDERRYWINSLGLGLQLRY